MNKTSIHDKYPWIKKLADEKRQALYKSMTSRQAFEYARKTGKRIPEIEKKIRRSGHYSWHYAFHVMQCRWPDAESIIARRHETAYPYAKYVVQGRWPEGEPAILKNPFYAYMYVRDVLKAQWVEGEAVMKGTKYWKRYLKVVDRHTNKNQLGLNFGEP